MTIAADNQFIEDFHPQLKNVPADTRIISLSAKVKLVFVINSDGSDWWLEYYDGERTSALFATPAGANNEEVLDVHEDAF